ncbi:MAG: sigma-70 family RNA polymerase sigma factor [Aeromicrobium sp.]
MSENVKHAIESSDAELITAVRAGDNEAYGTLFERHRYAALRLARQLLPDAESEDLVSEAFTKVFVLLQDGKGPDLAFRAYLLTAIRRLHVDRIRATKRLRTTDDESELDRHVEFFDLAAINFERGTAADAFASLPERWQLVLWHLDVEGQKPAEIAPLLGMSANSVSALAYRAREGLRQAYLQHHLSDTAIGDCRWTTERMGAHVRKGLSNREAGRVEAHLDGCRRCMGIYLELAEVNSDLSGILAPAILGTAAAGYLAGSGAVVATASGGVLGLKALLAKVLIEPAKGAASAIGSQGAIAAVTVAVVATGGVVAVAATRGHDNKPTAQSPNSVVTTNPGTTETPSATPSVEPSPETATPTPAVPTAVTPTVAPALVAPTTSTPTTSTPSPAPVVVQPSPSPPPTTTPPPPPPPVVPSDLGIGAITITSDAPPFQRRITVPVTSQTDGKAKDLDLTLTVAFDRAVTYRGVVSAEWHCVTPRRNAIMKSMTCTRHQSGAEIPVLLFKVRGILPSATVSISAAGNDDPNPANDSAQFKANPWLIP